MTDACNVCGSTDVNNTHILPDYPLNSLYIPSYSADKKFVSDFEVYQCATCFHIQGVSRKPLTAFYNDEYAYTTHNSGVQNRQGLMVDLVLQHCKGKTFNRVIEVGCYNLSLLKKLKEQGISANHWIGIDPVPIKEPDLVEGILFINGYIQEVDIPYANQDVPDLVISDQVFEHVPGVNKMLEGFSGSLSPNSSFIVCVPSLELLIENYSFHNIIHEHINYFTESSLSDLFNRCNYRLEHSQLNNEQTAGFLLQVHTKPANYKNTVDVEHVDVMPKFKHNYDVFLQSLAMVNDIVSNLDGKIYGFGASDITANLAYFLKSDLSQLSFIMDDTPYKQDRFIPGLKPMIVKSSTITDVSEAAVLITAPQANRPIIKHLLSLKPKRIINPLNVF